MVVNVMTRVRETNYTSYLGHAAYTNIIDADLVLVDRHTEIVVPADVRPADSMNIISLLDYTHGGLCDQEATASAFATTG